VCGGLDRKAEGHVRDDAGGAGGQETPAAGEELVEESEGVQAVVDLLQL
jgi:hypothetical protein